jgi:hypothetical protein
MGQNRPFRPIFIFFVFNHFGPRFAFQPESCKIKKAMGKNIFFALFLIVFLLSFGFSFTFFYHFRRFKPPIPFEERKILLFLFFGQIFFLFLSLLSFFLI